MTRRRHVDPVALGQLLAPGRAVATHAQLRELGVPSSTITYRLRHDAAWTPILPGVVLGHRGVPTPHERRLAALAYAGATGRLTGSDALVVLGVVAARRHTGSRVHVLVDHGCRRTSHGFALVTRTRRGGALETRDGLVCVPLARATIDACRRIRDLDAVRELVADVVQNHGVRPADLLAEIRAAARQRTHLAREVLSEIWAGIRSVGEARLRRVLREAGIPDPVWNAELRRPDDGLLVAVADALWPSVGLVVEIDSRAWHLSPESYRRTQRRQRLLAEWGLTVLPVSPADLASDPAAVCAQVASLLASLPPRGCRLAVQTGQAA